MSIEIRNLSKEYGSHHALRDVSLTITAGEFIAILGPSGCGKTTLLRLLAGFDTPTTGEIWMNGRQISSASYTLPPEERQLGMVFQSFALWPHMNVREHIRFPLRHQKSWRNKSKQEEQARITEVLEMVGLAQQAERLPAELSGGQKQRVSFARAIVAKPPLLLMDEPLSSLDAKLRIEMRHEIQSLHRKTGAAILYVTHDQGEALAMADRIVVMKDGMIEQIGTPEEIYTRPHTTFVATFVGKANLVKGSWREGSFIPLHSQLIWDDAGIGAAFQEQGLYPVRPEQFQMNKAGAGIKAKVTHVQYQGKEIHYLVEANGEQLEVHGKLLSRYAVGDIVYLQLK